MTKISEATFNELREVFNKAVEEAFGAGVKEGREGVTTSVDEPETIEHDGLKLRKVDRKAHEGDYIRPTVNSASDYLLTGCIYGPVDKLNHVKGEDGLSFPVYTNRYRRTPETVEVFEVSEHMGEIPLQDVPIIKSPNQQRKELNQRAREFVESKYFCGNFTGEKVINGYHGHNTVEFILNREKNTVVAILRLAYGWTGKVQAKGIAKCMPGDVFNEWIGKAIALARALEIDIPQEFTDAVQPDEVVIGMDIIYYYDTERGLCTVISDVGNGVYPINHTKLSIANDIKHTIIDDTNAIYGESS